MDSVSFHLQVFEGPLDLLMHLLKKNKLSIYEIHIKEITEQFFEYLDQMEELNMEISSEFLLVAAQLLLIKSRMLLPKYEEEDEEDPRKELIDRLSEYQKYKQAAEVFGETQHASDHLYFGTGENIPLSPGELQEHLNIPIEKLLEAVANILERGERKAPPSRDSFKGIVGRVKVSVGEKASFVRGLLRQRKRVNFREIFEGMETRPEVVATFLAVLEMIREGRIHIEEENGDFICTEGEHADEYE